MVSPIVAIIVIAVVVVLAVLLLYYAQKPSLGGGGGTKLSKSAVDARRIDLKRWEDEKKQAKVQGRIPDVRLMPKPPIAYMQDGGQQTTQGRPGSVGR